MGSEIKSKKPTDILKSEHEVIEVSLEILEEICKKLEEEGNKSPDVKRSLEEDIEKVLEFITTFADKCHHGKEEKHLFSAMEESGIPREGGPIGVMLYEHDVGRKLVASMKESLGKYKGGNPEEKIRFIKSAREYISLLRNHIDKENNVLFKLADEHIPEEKQREIVKGFEDVEKDIGEGKHEELHKLIHELSKIYLNK